LIHHWSIRPLCLDCGTTQLYGFITVIGVTDFPFSVNVGKIKCGHIEPTKKEYDLLAKTNVWEIVSWKKGKIL